MIPQGAILSTRMILLTAADNHRSCRNHNRSLPRRNQLAVPTVPDPTGPKVLAVAVVAVVVAVASNLPRRRRRQLRPGWKHPIERKEGPPERRREERACRWMWNGKRTTDQSVVSSNRRGP